MIHVLLALSSFSVLFLILSIVTIRRNLPARNPGKGAMQYQKKERKKERTRDDQITFFAVAVVDLTRVCVELALLFLHRNFDNNFDEDIIKSFLHLFVIQS